MKIPFGGSVSESWQVSLVRHGKSNDWYIGLGQVECFQFVRLTNVLTFLLLRKTPVGLLHRCMNTGNPQRKLTK